MPGREQSSIPFQKIVGQESAEKPSRVSEQTNLPQLTDFHAPEQHLLLDLSDSNPNASPIDEHRAQVSEPRKRKPHTPEARAKIGAASKGRRLSPETRAKIGAARKGRTHTPETRAKIG